MEVTLKCLVPDCRTYVLTEVDIHNYNPACYCDKHTSSMDPYIQQAAREVLDKIYRQAVEVLFHELLKIEATKAAEARQPSEVLFPLTTNKAFKPDYLREGFRRARGAVPTPEGSS